MEIFSMDYYMPYIYIPSSDITYTGKNVYPKNPLSCSNKPPLVNYKYHTSSSD
jgi:hypothetical protein